MAGPLPELLALRYLGDLIFECFQIWRFLFENDIGCTQRGKVITQYMRLSSTSLPDHSDESLQFLLDLVRLTRVSMKCESRDIHSCSPCERTSYPSSIYLIRRSKRHARDVPTSVYVFSGSILRVQAITTFSILGGFLPPHITTPVLGDFCKRIS